MKNENISSMITLSEESRRMQDMMKMYSMNGMDMGIGGADQRYFPGGFNLSNT